jgi:class 3 adenylate cyclase
MTSARIILVDGDLHTAALLAAELGRRGFDAVDQVADASLLAPLLAASVADVVIVNHRYQQEDALAACNLVRRLAGDCATLVIAAPGPAMAAVRGWAQRFRSIDAIVEKPLHDDRFYRALTDLLAVKAAARQVRNRTARLSNLVPEGALATAGNTDDPQAELFEAVVMFTDIRDSSRLITQLAPREFFAMLNEVLSAQTSRIQAGQGSVVKYTGDGVMAIFRGMGRSYLALRCGLELAAMSRSQRLQSGVGIAQGLVLAGLIGDADNIGQRRQFDVIGATAHLAARLCARAEAGQVVATRELNAVAGVRNPAPQPFEKVSIRGFASAIDCVAFKPESA